MPIQLKKINKRYEDVNALNDISLNIEEGKTTVLIGSSGSGKSTLIRIIIGLIKKDSGEVIIDNREISSVNLLDIRKQIGYVIQDGGLFPHLTAKKNVSLIAEYVGWTKDKIENRINDLSMLTKFPLDGLERYPAELSGGQKQRVSLMRALMLDPKILLLDEPLGALDPLIRYDLQEDLKKIFKELKKTVILVTHDLSEAGFFGDKIVLLMNGKIIQTGTIEDLIKRPKDGFVTRFITAQRAFEIN
ncbi:MAG: ATP-binding cassette domain-containing protein [Ignavibacteriaceae bacterium]